MRDTLFLQFDKELAGAIGEQLPNAVSVNSLVRAGDPWHGADSRTWGDWREAALTEPGVRETATGFDAARIFQAALPPLPSQSPSPGLQWGGQSTVEYEGLGAQPVMRNYTFDSLAKDTGDRVMQILANVTLPLARTATVEGRQVTLRGQQYLESQVLFDRSRTLLLGARSGVLRLGELARAFMKKQALTSRDIFFSLVR